MSGLELLNMVGLVLLGGAVVAFLWFWVIRDQWRSRQVWKRIEAYHGFGLRWENPELKGTVEGVYVKALPYEAAIVVPTRHEPPMHLDAFAAEDGEGESVYGKEGEVAMEGYDGEELVHFRFGEPALDEYFNYAISTPEARDQLLGSPRALDALREMVRKCKVEPVSLDFYYGMFRLQLESAPGQGHFRGIDTDLLDRWIPRLVKLVQAFNDIEALGAPRGEDETEWMWDW